MRGRGTGRGEPEESPRSQEHCPVCGAQQLALDQPPQIDILGVQPYTDLLGMGDLKLQSPPGIVCLHCGTRWHDIDAFRANRPEPAAPPPEGQDAEKEPPVTPA